MGNKLFDNVGRKISKTTRSKPKKHWLTKKVNRTVNKTTRPLNKVGRKSKRTKRKRRRK